MNTPGQAGDFTSRGRPSFLLAGSSGWSVPFKVRTVMNPFSAISYFLGTDRFLKVQFKLVNFQKTEIALGYISIVKKKKKRPSYNC